MTRKRFQKLLMSKGIPARQAKAYKIPSKHKGICYYGYSTDAGETWVSFNGNSYQNWWNDSVIINSEIFTMNLYPGLPVPKKPYSKSWYRVPEGLNKRGTIYKNILDGLLYII